MKLLFINLDSHIVGTVGFDNGYELVTVKLPFIDLDLRIVSGTMDLVAQERPHLY